MSPIKNFWAGKSIAGWKNFEILKKREQEKDVKTKG